MLGVEMEGKEAVGFSRIDEQECIYPTHAKTAHFAGVRVFTSREADFRYGMHI